MCPAVLRDSRCVVGLPVDIIPFGILNCATIDDLPSPNTLYTLNASEFLELVRMREVYGRPWCILSFFYSPNCVFSAKMAESFYRVAPLFPKLRIVAIDVSIREKHTESLISQYGIASTPVIALWESGIPRYRLYDDYSNLNSLTRIIETQSDLRRKKHFVDETPVSVSRNGIFKIDVNPDSIATNINDYSHSSFQREMEQFLQRFYYLNDNPGFDWCFFAASLTLLISITYFIFTSPKAYDLIHRRLVRRFIL